MRTKMNHKQERGVALLLAIVALLLISAAALALMFSSDTETAISVNYRDKQVAIYAALAGIEEARERINPAYGDLAAYAPTSLPSTGAKNVLYLVNPGPGETVASIAPWSPTINGKPNPYFDTELCQEGVLGMTGTPGVPCDPGNSAQVPPTGDAWYQVIDVSNPPSTDGDVWKLKTPSGAANPIRYKWTRVVLKSDNMTPAKVGDGSGKQVCWVAPHEQQIQTGLGTNCQPPMTRGVTNIAIIDQGHGYASAPSVTISGGGGSGATATAEIGRLDTGVTSLNITDGGSGYTTAPAVTITGDGSGATASASLGGGVPLVTGTITPSVTGTPPCYPENIPLQATIDNTYAQQAGSAQVVLTGRRCVSKIAVTAGNKCSQSATYTITASNGSGTIAFSGTAKTGTKTNGSIPVTSVAVTNPGNYSSVPTSFTATSGGSSCSMTVTPTYGVQVSSVNVTDGGLYTGAPKISVSGATPASGSGTMSITGVLNGTPAPDKVTSLTLLTHGANYTTASLVIAPPGGSGKQATGTASLDLTNGVVAIKWTPGSNYYTSPTVTITGGGGTGAKAAASVGSGGTTGAGQVYLITSMAQTLTGARAMAQMEVAEAYTNSQFNLQIGGAVSLIGPNAKFGQPSSSGFKMNGVDANSCGDPSTYNKPALGVMDQSTVTSIVQNLKRPDNYTGVKGTTPDIENVSDAMGNPTPEGLEAFADAIASVASHKYGANPSSIALGTEANPVIDYVDGDYTMGPTTGYGILLVTGQLTFHGDYSWKGLVLVIGKGASIMNGGGQGLITGAVFLANTGDGTSTTLGQPNADWSGGGGNGIQYDHCWADNLLGKVPLVPEPADSPLKVISLRFLDL